MTVAGDDTPTGESRHRQSAGGEAAGAPPWAAEPAREVAGVPPPWENGPWPGPGGVLPESPAVAVSGRPAPSARQDEQAGPVTPRTVLVTGLLPLVVPGLVVGVLGLRRSRAGEPGRRAAVLAVVASLAWAVIIVVVAVASTGGSASGCGYPANVHQAYASVMADIRGGAPASTQEADLAVAAGRANSAAAAAGQISVRAALFALAGDLQQARADVIADRVVPASVQARLASDGAALSASCRS
jgi:hypothetical protein